MEDLYRVVTVTDPSGNITNDYYTMEGELTQTASPGGREKSSFTDSLGRGARAPYAHTILSKAKPVTIMMRAAA